VGINRFMSILDGLYRAGAALVLVLALPSMTLAEPSPSPSASASVRTDSPASGTAQPSIVAFAQAWNGVPAYTATVTVWERMGDQTQTEVLAYSFQKPSDATVHVNAGKNAGVTLVWSGGTSVVAHRGSGFAALFKRTLDLHDPQVSTIRGSSIDQLSFGAILAHARQQVGALSESTDPVAGGGADVITLLPTSPAADAGLTREVLTLSPVTHLPVEVLGYDGATLVRKIDFSAVTISGSSNDASSAGADSHS
jgi:hypothetical protein